MPVERYFSTKIVLAAVALIALCIVGVRFTSHGASSSGSVLSASDSTPVPVQALKVPPHNPSAPIGDLPDVRPGISCDQPSETLGKPTEQDEYGRVWVKQEYQISIVTDAKCAVTGVSAWVEDGQAIRTRDQIVLGRTTLADAMKKLAPRIITDSEAVVVLEGNPEAVFTLTPTPDLPYKTLYRAAIVPGTGKDLPDDPPFDSFLNQPISEYSVDIADPKGNRR